MKKILLLIASFALLTSCSVGQFYQDAVFKLDGKFATKQLSFTTGSEIVKLTVEVADNARKRQQGLMKRDKLEAGKGMWFIFQGEAPRIFWMKNTLIPLDLMFFNNKHEVVSVVENMTPCKTSFCPSYSSVVPAMYALEVPAGFVEEKNVKVGDSVAEDK